MSAIGGPVLNGGAPAAGLTPAGLTPAGQAPAVVGCAVQDLDDEAHAGLSSLLRWRVFPGENRQLRTLRGWLMALLPDCPERYDLLAVATELASNAVKHTASGRGGTFAVALLGGTRVMRVAVADGGAETGPAMQQDPAGEHGRGLLIVRGLSASTGACGDEHGRLVWAEIPWPGTARGARLPPADQVLAGRLAHIPGPPRELGPGGSQPGEPASCCQSALA